MISLDVIEQSILELERADTSFSVCDKLADLYIVRDHLRGYSVSPEAAIQAEGASDFLKAVNGKNPSRIWPIMDELMETVIKSMHPAVYNRIMEKIKDGD